MRKVLFSIFVLFLFAKSFSQETGGESYSLGGDAKTKASKSERLVFDVFTDVWQKLHDSISTYGLNRGVSISIFNDNPIGYSNFSFGWGLNITAHNLYSDAYPTDMYDTAIHATTVAKPFLKYTTWLKIPTYVSGHKIDYSINKLTLAYFEIPLELRFHNRSEYKKRIKFSAGFKVGWLMSSHTKYDGDDYTNPVFPSREVKFKTFDIPNISSLRYGVTARFSLGYLGVYAYYGLNPLFEKDKGSQMFPLSVGISIIPF